MREELDKKLCEAFPILYQQRNMNMSQTAMCWGFSHGDGWFDLIWNLSEKLENINKSLPSDGDLFVVATQVKEKFGTLRFYTGGIPSSVSEEVYKLINEAESISGVTCEECGKDGKSRTGGWVKTLCDDCVKPITPKEKEFADKHFYRKKEGL